MLFGFSYFLFFFKKHDKLILFSQFSSYPKALSLLIILPISLKDNEMKNCLWILRNSLYVKEKLFYFLTYIVTFQGLQIH